jgi:hypothetical protein
MTNTQIVSKVGTSLKAPVNRDSVSGIYFVSIVVFSCFVFADVLVASLVDQWEMLGHTSLGSPFGSHGKYQTLGSSS